MSYINGRFICPTQMNFYFIFLDSMRMFYYSQENNLNLFKYIGVHIYTYTRR